MKTIYQVLLFIVMCTIFVALMYLGDCTMEFNHFVPGGFYPVCK